VGGVHGMSGREAKFIKVLFGKPEGKIGFDSDDQIILNGTFKK